MKLKNTMIFDVGLPVLYGIGLFLYTSNV